MNVGSRDLYQVRLETEKHPIPTRAEARDLSHQLRVHDEIHGAEISQDRMRNAGKLRSHLNFAIREMLEINRLLEKVTMRLFRLAKELAA